MNYSHSKLYKQQLSLLTIMHTQSKLGHHPQQCPRAQVRAMLVDRNGGVLSAGRNLRPEPLGQCDCNSSHDTMVGASPSCMAVHAEIQALMTAEQVYKGHYMMSTRPPCKECLKVLLSTNVKVIVTTDEWPDRDNSQHVWESADRQWITYSITEMKEFDHEHI